MIKKLIALMKKPSRYERALTRNLYEIRSALSERNAINIFVEERPNTSWSFFTYAYIALKNDMVAHAIKVLDKHPQAASFWYLYRCETKEVSNFFKKIKLDMIEIDDFWKSLKIIRDKTHFHIDRNGVINPADIWEQADIRGKNFNKVMDGLWDTLNYLYKLKHNEKFNQPLYEAEDVKDIIDAVLKAGITI